jgi:hypothetical protein
MIRIKTCSRRVSQMTCTALILGALAACGNGIGLGQSGPDATPAGTDASGKTGQRDVEAPEVFDISEAGLWDGRPSLGVIWVAHPDVTDPQRVIIRNTANGQSVVGALFRRQRDLPGPRLQASSDAAEALAMLPGAPVNLHVTALIREPVTEEAPEAPDSNTEASAQTPSPDGAQTEAEPGSASSGGFRWPWSKPEPDAAGATSALDTPPEISESSLEPVEEAALMHDDRPSASPARLRQGRNDLPTVPYRPGQPGPRNPTT